MQRLITFLFLRPILRLAKIAFILAALFLASQAQARGAVQFGQHETLIFAAETQRSGPTGPLALCHRTNMRTMFFMGYWLENRGMVLAPNGCASESYFGLAPGFDAAELAETPIAPLNRDIALHYARGFFWLYAVPIFLLISTLMTRRNKAKAETRREALALEPGPVFQFIDAMCHAAAIDGCADQSEISYITDVARDLTGRDYRDEHFEFAVFHCDKLRSAGQFRQFAIGLGVEQKQMIMRGVLSVVMADGTLEKSEKTFLKNMSKALGLRRKDVRALMSRASIAPEGAALA